MRVVNLAIGIVVTLVLVRSLGSSGFGTWSSIFAITQIVASFGELGLNQIALNRIAKDPENSPAWLGALLSLRLLIALATTAISMAVVLLIAPNSDSRLAGVILSLLLFIGVPTTLNVVFQLRIRNDISMAIMTLNSVAWLAAVVAVVNRSGGIVAFAVAFLLTSALTAIITAVVALRMATVHLRGVRPLWRPLLQVGIALGAAGVLVTAYVRLDQILVLELAGTYQAGLYGAAYRLLDQIQFIPISVMTTLFPLIAAAYPKDLNRARKLLQTAGEYLTMASLPILAFTIVAARPIVTFLFGAEFRAAAPAVPVLAGAFVLISLGYLAGNMIVILELQRRFVRYAAFGLLVNVILNLALIPLFGFIAAAWSTLVTEITIMTLSMSAVLEKLPMTFHFDRMLRIVAAAAAMGLIAWFGERLDLPLVAVAVTAGISYLICLFLVRAFRPKEIAAILHKGATAVED
jgi:O-antigen/teichoic acid export membrane protein